MPCPLPCLTNPPTYIRITTRPVLPVRIYIHITHLLSTPAYPICPHLSSSTPYHQRLQHSTVHERCPHCSLARPFPAQPFSKKMKSSFKRKAEKVRMRWEVASTKWYGKWMRKGERKGRIRIIEEEWIESDDRDWVDTVDYRGLAAGRTPVNEWTT